MLLRVVHLLDGPALFSAIASLLGQINSILAVFSPASQPGGMSRDDV